MGRSTTCRCRSSPKCCAQGGDLRRALSQDRQLEQLNKSWSIAWWNAPRTGVGGAADAQRGAPQPGAGRRPDGIVGVGSGQRPLRLGRRQYRIFGVDPDSFEVIVDNIKVLIHPEDWKHLQNAITPATQSSPSFQTEFRVCRPNGSCAVHRHGGGERRCDRQCRAHQRRDHRHHRSQGGRRCQRASREVDHRARNALALVQSIVRLTRSDTVKSYIAAVDGRRGVGARIRAAGAEPPAGRRSRPPGRGGACPLSGRRRRRGIAASGPDGRRSPHRADARRAARTSASTNRQYMRCRWHRDASWVKGNCNRTAGLLHWSRAADRNEAAGRTRLRHQGNQQQHRAPARRQGRFRLAARGLNLATACRAATASSRRATATRTGRSRGTSCAAAADRDRQPHPARRGRNPGRHDDEGHPERARLRCDRPLQPAGRGDDRAVHEDIDAGIIDVNLGGEFVYPVADVLTARKIPSCS